MRQTARRVLLLEKLQRGLSQWRPVVSAGISKSMRIKLGDLLLS
jgi:hypothetical protein